MKWLRALQVVALGLGLAYTLPLACGSGGVVGGKCKDGYVNCNGECVDLMSDYRNCSSCGNLCPGKEGCGDGVCDPDVPRPQGGASSTGGNGPGPGEAGNGATTNLGGDGQLPDGGFFDSPVDGMGDADAPLECMPPFNTPANCGACGNKCVDPEPLCEADGEGGFHCVPFCDPPLVECNGRCVMVPDAYQSDPQNCGKCGNVCPSDICQKGECQGAKYGNVALLCMDFNSATRDSGPTALLGNAIFAANKNPVRVLAYTRGTAAAAATRVNTVITWAGEARGRTAEITAAKTIDAVTTGLNVKDYDVFLIHDLDQAKSGEPAAAATAWESTSVLTSFSRAGGVIVVIDGGDGIAEMHELINAGNLFDPTGATSIDGQTDMTLDQVFNNAPFDVLGVNVISPFLGTSHTCTFDITAKAGGDTIYVLGNDNDGKTASPVAIHRVIAP
jgi:hypothetical protein